MSLKSKRSSGKIRTYIRKKKNEYVRNVKTEVKDYLSYRKKRKEYDRETRHMARDVKLKQRRIRQLRKAKTGKKKISRKEADRRYKKFYSML